MIKRVVAFAFANVQQTEALVFECCRVGWTHRLLVRWAVVITNTTGIKCGESFADSMVFASNVCAGIDFFKTKYKITSYEQKFTIYQTSSWDVVGLLFSEDSYFEAYKGQTCFSHNRFLNTTFFLQLYCMSAHHPPPPKKNNETNILTYLPQLHSPL